MQAQIKIITMTDFDSYTNTSSTYAVAELGAWSLFNQRERQSKGSILRSKSRKYVPRP